MFMYCVLYCGTVPIHIAELCTCVYVYVLCTVLWHSTCTYCRIMYMCICLCTVLWHSTCTYCRICTCVYVYVLYCIVAQYMYILQNILEDDIHVYVYAYLLYSIEAQFMYTYMYVSIAKDSHLPQVLVYQF